MSEDGPHKEYPGFKESLMVLSKCKRCKPQFFPLENETPVTELPASLMRVAMCE